MRRKKTEGKVRQRGRRGGSDGDDSRQGAAEGGGGYRQVSRDGEDRHQPGNHSDLFFQLNYFIYQISE